jgi:hypothetical protein
MEAATARGLPSHAPSSCSAPREALTLTQDVTRTWPPNPPSDLNPGPYLACAFTASRPWSDVAVSCAVFAATWKKTALAWKRWLMAPT